MTHAPGFFAAWQVKIRSLAWIAGLFILLFSGGCALASPFAAPSPTPAPSALPPTPTSTPTSTAAPGLTASPTPAGTLPVWGRFAAPRGTSATLIPPPMPTLDFPPEARAVILAGLDRPNPYPGRADALVLLIYHPRFSKAALISIPPDLFGYLPGQTMQRLYSAYPLGGARLLQQTIAYNLGIFPNAWLVIHSDDFAILVDELGGLTVPVLEDIPDVCGDILYQGEVGMDGATALCYVRLRVGPDEAARGLRQQQVLNLLLERLVSGGSLLKVPELFGLFRSRIDTNLTSSDAVEAIPMALRLSDPNRMAYFKIGRAETELWQISEQPPASVFLPRRDAIQAVLRDAVAFINKPSPLSDVVLTLEAQLTASPTSDSLTPPAESTPTRPPRVGITPTATASRTPTPSLTPTATITPTPTITPTVTNTFSP